MNEIGMMMFQVNETLEVKMNKISLPASQRYN
jgi:hypothetical protein